MKDMIAIQIMILTVSVYLLSMFGLSLLIGGWAFAVMVPTMVPAIFGAVWLADRLVPRR